MRLKPKKGIRIAALILGLILLALFAAYEIHISYNGLKTTEYTVRSEKITGSMTVCLIADLHDHRFGERNNELVSLIREAEPDLILMAGDFINKGYRDASAATELIPRLTDTAPVFFSLGNQERGYMAAGTSDLLEEIKQAGAVVLEEEYRILNIRGSRICLGGMYDFAFAFDGVGHMDKDGIDPDRRLFLEEFQAEDAFKIMMCHRPDSFIFGEAADTWDIDLVVSGHLHGGQVVLPFAGGLYAGDQGFFPRYVYGEHHFKAVRTMLITSGLGSDREKLPRFNNIPEVVFITLEQGQQGPGS